MNKKFKKFLRSFDQYSGRIFIVLCLLSAIIAFTTISVTEAWGDFFYTYPEEEYQKLEQEADKIISNLDFNADDLEMTLSDTVNEAFAANITIEVENLGKSNQEIKIERDYKNQIHQNFASVAIIICIILLYLLLLILLLVILVVFVWIFIAIITLILFIIDKIKNLKNKKKQKK